MPSPQTTSQDIIVRAIKILDIGWASIAYLLLAMVFIQFINFIYGDFDEKKEQEKSTVTLILELFLHAWLIGITIYLARNLFPLIPWPFDGVYGYSHLKVKEVVNATMFATFIVGLNERFRTQVSTLRERFTKHKVKDSTNNNKAQDI